MLSPMKILIVYDAADGSTWIWKTLSTVPLWKSRSSAFGPARSSAVTLATVADDQA